MKDNNESSKHVIAREILKKTELEIILEDLQYLFNNSEYDCDVYKLKMYSRIKLDYTELAK